MGEGWGACREGRNSGFRTGTVGGVVSGLLASPVNRRLCIVSRLGCKRMDAPTES